MTDTTLAQRLRAQGTLSVCPYDRRSPDYRTAPNDKPCPVCGGEPEGPDKCTGADLRVMAEAADRIEADASTIARLTAANKALMADWTEFAELYKASEAKLAKAEAGETAYKTMLAQAEDDLIKTNAELAEARTLLEPFAKEAKRWDGYSDEEHLVESWPGGPSSDLTVFHLRAARSFLAAKEAREDGN